MVIVHTDGRDKRFIELCRELDDFFNNLVGQEKQKDYEKYNALDKIHDVVLIINDNKIAGGGSFKRYNDDTAEVKRVFVRKSERHNGFGRTIIKELEKTAYEKGYKKLILETGVKLKSAQGMYKEIGFYKRENFGQYKGMTESVCMERYIGVRTLQEYLYKLELELLKPEVRKSTERLGELLDKDYREFCSSGNIARYNEGDIYYEPNVRFETKNFNSVVLGEECIQITYKMKKVYEKLGTEKYSNRSSIWRCFSGKWKMIFHQGTPTNEY